MAIYDAEIMWREAALDLPRLHSMIAEGRVIEALALLAALPDLEAPPDGEALRSDTSSNDPRVVKHVLDVLMVEAFTRRHSALLGADLHARIGRAARLASDLLGMRPIIGYPLYIRANPMAPAEMRRFTPLAAEERFIRMHRFIEDRLDEIIERLFMITNSPDPAAVFSEQISDFGDAFRRINRVMAGFRDPQRMPNHDFVHGFRPYFDSVRDPNTGAVLLDGPSGLQSPTFRIIAMLTGYEDPVLDDWTRRISEYHDPQTRLQLLNALSARDAGRSLNRNVDCVLGSEPSPKLPHLHPDYASHIPDLLRLARHGGYLSLDVESVFAEHDIELGRWPAEPAAGPASFGPPVHTEPTDRQVCALGPYVELESMLFGFHVEHVAVAAAQIGHERGTGGTSGVEFLMMALFRRAFPRLWVSGIAGRIVERAVG